MSGTMEGLRRRMEPIPQGKYLIGLSGGADSTALLLMLLPDIRMGKIRLEAIHVNHGLRGSESDQDEHFCLSLCESEGIAFKAYHTDLSGRTDEAAAREARFSFFRQRYDETSADGLILAHNADDQAETFLMRLLRGAGADGLEGMKKDETVRGIRILRPMLGLRREEIRETLRSEGVRWRDDSSNFSSLYLRNRIRTQLIPVMEQLSGTAVNKICAASCLIAQDNEALQAEAREILRNISGGWFLDAEILRQSDQALRHRVLRMWWQEQAPELEEHTLSAEQTCALDELLDTAGGKANLPAGMHAVRAGRYLFLRERMPAPPDPVSVAGQETRFGDYCLTKSPSENSPGDGKRTQEIPEGFLRGCVIRSRLPGDRIRPFGSKGSRKLQDYLTDRHIPEPFRDIIPLLCRGNEVLLVCGVGAGGIPDWDPDGSSVRLTWHGEIPWNK